jgi:hypothetical protein
MKKFINNKGFANVDDLTYHPANEKLYPRENFKEEIKKLRKKIKEWYAEYGYPNHTVIQICKKTGVIYAGNFRVLICKMLGIKWIKAEYCKRIFKETAWESDEMEFLAELNDGDAKRDESNFKIALVKWDAMCKAHFDKTGKTYGGEDRNKFARDSKIDKDVFLKLIKINEEDPDLIGKLVSREMSVKEAWDLVSDPKPKEIVDPKRHSFYDDLMLPTKAVKPKQIKSIGHTEKLFVKDYIVKRGIAMTQASLDEVPYFDRDVGWEKQFPSTHLSNSIMSSTAEAFNNTGVKNLKCKSAGAVSNKTYADVLFPYLTKLANEKAPAGERYFDTQVEIKMCNWKHTAGETKIYSASGSARMPEQDMIVGSHCGNFTKFLIMMVTIKGEHWTKASKQAYISFATLFKLNPTYLLGELFESSGKVEIDWGQVE